MSTLLSFLPHFSLRKHVVLILFGGAALFSLISLRQPMISEGDAYARSNILEIMKNGHLVFNSTMRVWLPFQFSIEVLPLYIYNNVFLLPRLMTFLFSLGSVILIYLYTRDFFTGRFAKLAAIAAATVYFCLPMRLILSTQTLTEPVFVFFLLLSLHLLFRPQPKYCLSLIALNIAHATRYESWFLLPFIWLVVIHHPGSVKRKLSYVFGSLIFPAFWIFWNWYEFHDPLDFFNQKYQIAQYVHLRAYYHWWPSTVIWWQNLITVFPVTFVVLSLIGIWIGYHKTSQKILFLLASFLPIFLFGTLVAQVFAGSMEWQPHRYLIILTSLAMPLLGAVAACTWQAGEKLHNLKWQLLLFISICFFFTTELYSTWITTQPVLTTEVFSPVARPHNVLSMIEFCNQYQAQHPTVHFLYISNNVGENKFWTENAFYYLTGHPGLLGEKMDKKDFTHWQAYFQDTLVYERNNSSLDQAILSEWRVLYQNSNFLVLAKK